MLKTHLKCYLFMLDIYIGCVDQYKHRWCSFEHRSFFGVDISSKPCLKGCMYLLNLSTPTDYGHNIQSLITDNNQSQFWPRDGDICLIFISYEAKVSFLPCLGWSVIDLNYWQWPDCWQDDVIPLFACNFGKKIYL